MVYPERMTDTQSWRNVPDFIYHIKKKQVYILEQLSLLPVIENILLHVFSTPDYFCWKCYHPEDLGPSVTSREMVVCWVLLEYNGICSFLMFIVGFLFWFVFVYHLHNQHVLDLHVSLFKLCRKKCVLKRHSQWSVWFRLPCLEIRHDSWWFMN